jgi:hypothetical protein
MWLLIVEALAALGLLVFIVWWTMFAGRRRGERPASDEVVPTDAGNGGNDPARRSAPACMPSGQGSRPTADRKADDGPA